MKIFRTLLFAVPLFGWMLRSAYYGGTSERVFFAANVAALWAIAIHFIGYAALIVPALAATGSMLVVLVVLSAGGLVFGGAAASTEPASNAGNHARREA